MRRRRGGGEEETVRLCGDNLDFIFFEINLGFFSVVINVERVQGFCGEVLIVD